MAKFAVIFETPDDMTAEEVESVISMAFDYAVDDYHECLDAVIGDEMETECYQSKIDGYKRLGDVKEVIPHHEVDDYWAEDPDYPLEDWNHEVACDDTRLGYHEWVRSQKEMEELDGSTDND